MPRIVPAEPPYEPAIAAELERIMPKGVPPLVLFRTMARSPRVFARMFASGLLDKGPLSLRQRELLIDRTTARLGAEYEWGVHIAFFAERVGFTPEQVAATVKEGREAGCWTAEFRSHFRLTACPTRCCGPPGRRSHAGTTTASASSGKATSPGRRRCGWLCRAGIS